MNVWRHQRVILYPVQRWASGATRGAAAARVTCWPGSRTNEKKSVEILDEFYEIIGFRSEARKYYLAQNFCSKSN
jgi:hypothetical protein